MHRNVVLTALMGWVAIGATGCSLSIDQIFEMKEGSGVDVYLVGQSCVGRPRDCSPEPVEMFQDRLTFEGGTVMRINVSTSLLDYLDGTVDGDVEIVDLLFAAPKFIFLIFNSGLICIVPDDPRGGGTFTYDVLAQQATFDMIVNTKALITNAAFASMIRGGAFKFPFDLEATIPLTLVDALGLFTGTGSLEVTQQLDAHYSVPIVQDPAQPQYDVIFPIHVLGEVTLATTDTFPTPPTVLSCIDYLAN